MRRRDLEHRVGIRGGVVRLHQDRLVYRGRRGARPEVLEAERAVDGGVLRPPQPFVGQPPDVPQVQVRVNHHAPSFPRPASAVSRRTPWLDGGMSFELAFSPALSQPQLLAAPVAAALRNLPDADQVEVAEIDPALADTAAFCERYGVSPAESANCVVIAAKRGGEVTYAACMGAATTRADVNGLVRRHLDARKASFAPVEAVTEASGMEYGGITPIGFSPGRPPPGGEGGG